MPVCDVHEGTDFFIDFSTQNPDGLLGNPDALRIMRTQEGSGITVEVLNTTAPGWEGLTNPAPGEFTYRAAAVPPGTWVYTFIPASAADFGRAESVKIRVRSVAFLP